MAKEAYIEIDGKRTPLTIEQMKALGIYEEPKKSSFDRVEKKQSYYYITNCGHVYETTDYSFESDNTRHDIANYCTDKEILQQRVLHETLNRLLWRFSMENDGDKIDWKDNYSEKYVILSDNKDKCFKVQCYHFTKSIGSIYFATEKIAQRAIDEIIIPFMKENPDFIW